MPAKLTVCYSNRPASENYLYEDRLYQIGRGAECDVLLAHPSVSRRHAQVNHPENLWVLNDEHSRNGTKVNGLSITSSTLVEDAIISVGQLDCLFETKSKAQLDAIVAHEQWRLAESKAKHSGSFQDNLSNQLTLQLQNVLSLTGTHRALVLLGNELSKLQVVANCGMSKNDFAIDQFEGSIGAIELCLAKGQQIISMDVSRHELLASRKSIELKQIAALACIPLFNKNELIGLVYTDSKMSDKILTELDLEILSSISLQIESTLQAITLQFSIDSLQSTLLTSSGLKDLPRNHLLSLCH